MKNLIIIMMVLSSFSCQTRGIGPEEQDPEQNIADSTELSTTPDPIDITESSDEPETENEEEPDSETIPQNRKRILKQKANLKCPANRYPRQILPQILVS